MPTYQSSTNALSVQVVDYIHATTLTNTIPDNQIVEEVELCVANAELTDDIGVLSGQTIRWEITGAATATFPRATGADGISTLPVYFDWAGVYYIQPFFDGDATHNVSSGPMLQVDVFTNLIATVTQVVVPPTIVVGQPTSIATKVTVGAGTPLAGAPVTLYIDGVQIQTQKLTATNGMAAWSVTFTLAQIGTHTVRIDTGEFAIPGTTITLQ